MKKTPPELDLIADVVLNYRPKPKSKAAKKRLRRSLRDQIAAGAVPPKKPGPRHSSYTAAFPLQ
jgi:hypothetical protein